MGNRADDYGTDVEIYVKALTTTIHAATPTGAPPSSTTCWSSSVWNATSTPSAPLCTSGTPCPTTLVTRSRSAWRAGRSRRW